MSHILIPGSVTTEGGCQRHLPAAAESGRQCGGLTELNLCHPVTLEVWMELLDFSHPAVRHVWRLMEVYPLVLCCMCRGRRRISFLPFGIFRHQFLDKWCFQTHFFLKDLFLLFFSLERRIYREERQRGRSSVR